MAKGERVDKVLATEYFLAGQVAVQPAHQMGKRMVWRHMWTFPCGGLLSQQNLSVLRKRLGVTVRRQGGHMVASLQQGDTNDTGGLVGGQHGRRGTTGQATANG